VGDYQNKTEIQQKNDDKKLVEFIKANLENFEPNHEEPVEVGPPEVKWIAGSGVLTHLSHQVTAKRCLMLINNCK